MKVIYFNTEKGIIDEVICTRVLFGATIVAALNEEGKTQEIIEIDYISSIEQ